MMTGTPGRRHRLLVLSIGLLLFFSLGDVGAQEQAYTPPGAQGFDDDDIARSKGSSGTVGQNYIDEAIPQTMVRFRFDANYADNVPDRAEFLYGPYQGQVNTNGQLQNYVFDGHVFREVASGGPPNRTNNFRLAESEPTLYQFTYAGRGLTQVESTVDAQVGSLYLEYAPWRRLSAFVEVPVVGVNPEINSDSSGVGDINAGFKFAFVYEESRVVSFQFRTYIPTGDVSLGLGTGHVSLEPALLFYQQINERTAVFGEFRDWIPVDGTNFAGNVIRYGLGCSWIAYENPKWWVAPVLETVGWTVLGGEETNVFSSGEEEVFTIRNAAGDTIVNAKFGLRFGFGQRSQFSISYARALTGDVWYKDNFQLEYRLSF